MDEQTYREIKTLREEIIDLDDRLSRMKRVYDDMLQNLDYDNLSADMRRERDGMSAQITFSAEGLKSVVSKGKDVVISKTAPADTNVIWYDSAENVHKQWEGDMWVQIDGMVEASSAIEQTAENITFEVRKTYGVKKYNSGASPYFPPPGSDVNSVWLNGNNGRYYYYSKILGGWRETADPVVKSHFEQSDDGFTLEGHVRLKGNAIVDGKISASEIEGTEISGGTITGSKIQTEPGEYGESIILNSRGGRIVFMEDAQLAGVIGAGINYLQIVATGGRNLYLGGDTFVHGGTESYYRAASEGWVREITNALDARLRAVES